MAPPPKWLITRRLIDSYVVKYIPTKVDNSKMYEEELFNCWRIHGIESDKCMHIVTKIQDSSSEYREYRQAVNKLKLQTEIKRELNRPVFSFQKKGRFKDLVPRQLNIYDGIF